MKRAHLLLLIPLAYFVARCFIGFPPLSGSWLYSLATGEELFLVVGGLGLPFDGRANPLGAILVSVGATVALLTVSSVLKEQSPLKMPSAVLLTCIVLTGFSTFMFPPIYLLMPVAAWVVVLLSPVCLFCYIRLQYWGSTKPSLNVGLLFHVMLGMLSILALVDFATLFLVGGS